MSSNQTSGQLAAKDLRGQTAATTSGKAKVMPEAIPAAPIISTGNELSSAGRSGQREGLTPMSTVIKGSVSSIQTYSYADPGFFLMNARVLG